VITDEDPDPHGPGRKKAAKKVQGRRKEKKFYESVLDGKEP